MSSASRLAARFLGVGNAGSELGNACCVLEEDAQPLLMIDCGYDALPRYLNYYGGLPQAIYLTHLHLDHIGGLENLFFRLRFAPQPATCHLYVPAGLIPLLQQRLADYPGTLAEGGANFWDVFHLIPVSDGFWHQGYRFNVFPTRHHLPGSSYGLALAGAFLYTGDTRPVPEQIIARASNGEVIFHDCSLTANPSHTGLEDLAREYSPDQRARMVLYHYATSAQGQLLRQAGYRVADVNDWIPLSPAAENSTARPAAVSMDSRRKP